MFRKLYDWMMKQAAGKYATPALAFVSFIESSVFPLPPDLMLVPMCLANRKKSFYYALVCTVASVLGGLAGYAIGYFLYQTVGVWALSLYGGAEEAYQKFSHLFEEYGAWIIIAKGLTPFPFKILTILSGMVKFNLVIFIVSSIVARAGRFFLVAGLAYFFGDPIREFIEKHLNKVLFGFFLLIVAGFVALKFLF
jgi:membrane protein YqaA with SNARE-associated domain